jgi:hypothetical protein
MDKISSKGGCSRALPVDQFEAEVQSGYAIALARSGDHGQHDPLSADSRDAEKVREWCGKAPEKLLRFKAPVSPAPST